MFLVVPWRSVVPLKSILSHSKEKRSIWAPGAMESTCQVREIEVSVTYGWLCNIETEKLDLLGR